MNIFEIYATLKLETSDYDNRIAGAKQAAESLGSAVSTTVSAGSMAYTGLVKNSVNAYGQYEQMVDGIKQLLDKSYDEVIDNSQKAYKTAQMSANDYLETATTLAGPLLRALGGDTEEIANLIDMAMTDASDNVNIFGSDMNFILRAYQGFGRQTFMMLDNLRLGYGGTKHEARDMLYDAKKLTETYTELSNIDLSNLDMNYDERDFSMLTIDNVIKAIHVMQEYKHITGTTLREGSETIQGTIRQTKAAWENLHVALAGGMDLGDAIDDLVDSIFGDGEGTGLLNVLLPRIATTMEGISEFLVKATPILAERIPEMIEMLRPSLERAVNSIGTLITTVLPSVIDLLWPVVRDTLSTLLDLITGKMHEEGGLFGIIADVIDFLRENADSIPALITAAWEAILALNIGSTLMEFATLVSGMFSKVGLIAMAIAALATIFFMYHDEFQSFFTSIGTFATNMFRVVQLQIENLKDLILNTDFGTLLQSIGVNVLLGLVDMAESAVQMIVDAINNMLDEVDIFGWKGSEHHITFGGFNATGLENKAAELNKKVHEGNDPTIRARMDERNKELDSLQMPADLPWFSSDDNRSFGERFQDFPTDLLQKGLELFGFKTDLFKPVSDETTESYKELGEAVGNLGTSFVESASAVVGGGEIPSLETGKTGTSTGKETGKGAGETTGTETEGGFLGALQQAADYIESDFVDSVAEGTTAITEEDGSFLDAIKTIGDNTDTTKGKLEAMGDYLKGAWLQAIQQGSNVEPLVSALQSIVTKLGEITTAAGQALQAVENLVNYAKENANSISVANTNGGGDGGAPKRAFGGSVLRGETYWVGEKGPEAFTAEQSGTIIPTSKIGGVNSQHFTFNFYGEIYGDESSFRSMVTRVAKEVVKDEVRAAV